MYQGVEKVAFVWVNERSLRWQNLNNRMHCQRKTIVSCKLADTAGPSTWHQRLNAIKTSIYQFILCDHLSADTGRMARHTLDGSSDQVFDLCPRSSDDSMISLSTENLMHYKKL